LGLLHLLLQGCMLLLLLLLLLLLSLFGIHNQVLQKHYGSGTSVTLNATVALNMYKE
jgi:hypothetical protein